MPGKMFASPIFCLSNGCSLNNIQPSPSNTFVNTTPLPPWWNIQTLPHAWTFSTSLPCMFYNRIAVIYLLYDIWLQESYLQEMSAGLFEDQEDDDSSDEEFSSGELETVAVNPPVRRDDKKTPAQKKKDKEKKKQVCSVMPETHFFSYNIALI